MEEIVKKQVIDIWVNHITTNQFVVDVEGYTSNNIDDSRLEAMQVIKVIIRDFINDDINLNEFKAALDVFNRHNNLWNFSAKMGQMYFNLLLKTNEDNIVKLSDLLKNVISEPKDLKDALKKIEELEKFTNHIFLNAEDKRRVPYPGSVGYFLSYFWQVHNHNKWPIIYSSLINGFREIGVWNDQITQKASYNYFYTINEELKVILSENSNKEISNWDIEHAFWNFKFPKNPYTSAVEESSEIQADTKTGQLAAAAEAAINMNAGTATAFIKEETSTTHAEVDFDISDYIIPKVAKLFRIKEGTEETHLYEPLVAETFRQMEFDVSILQQGPRRNPYAALKFREENTAFLVDVKISSVDYFTTTDDRALKESIKDNSIALKKEGYKNIGFIIVCHSFDENYDAFINYISWHTEIRKFLLITTDALLHLLAYKTRDKVKLESVVETMANFGNVVTSAHIIRTFEKVGE